MIKIPLHEGYLAARNGLESNSNPYDLEEQPDAYCEWQDGYIDGVQDMELENRSRWSFIGPAPVLVALLILVILLTWKLIYE